MRQRDVEGGSGGEAVQVSAGRTNEGIAPVIVLLLVVLLFLQVYICQWTVRSRVLALARPELRRFRLCSVEDSAVDRVHPHPHPHGRTPLFRLGRRDGELGCRRRGMCRKPSLERRAVQSQRRRLFRQRRQQVLEALGPSEDALLYSHRL